MKKKSAWVRLVLLIWVLVWLYFLIRPFYREHLAQTYSQFFSASVEQKRALIIGPDLYEFIQFCQRSLPPHAKYQIVGIDKDSVDLRRIPYYLYPNIKYKDYEFLLVYRSEDYPKEGHEFYKQLDEGRFILKKASP